MLMSWKAVITDQKEREKDIETENDAFRLPAQFFSFIFFFLFFEIFTSLKLDILPEKRPESIRNKSI